MRTSHPTLAAASLALLLFGRGASASPVVDPMGDFLPGSNGSYDITFIDAVYDATTLMVHVGLTSAPASPSTTMDGSELVGFIDLDVDKDPTTGEVSIQSDLSGVPSGLGMEFFVDLASEFFSPGMVEVFDSTFAFSGLAAIAYGPDFFEVAIPLSLIGPDDGAVSYGVIIGAAADLPSDKAVAMSMPVPEPTSLALLGVALVGFGLARARRA